jgi:hypothetical protein
MNPTGIKRLTNTSYSRPVKTYQETLTNEEIKEKLKDYKKVNDIKTVSIGTHIRYFSTDAKTNEKLFRLGGSLNKIDPEGKFIILSNGTTTWSVQIPTSIFFQKMTEAEYKDEIKKELKKELKKEKTEQSDDEISDLKKEIKSLKLKLDQYKEIEKDYKKKNDALQFKITTIENEIKKSKNKK